MSQNNIANFYSSVYKVQTDLHRIKQGKPAEKADCDAQLASITLGYSPIKI